MTVVKASSVAPMRLTVRVANPDQSTTGGKPGIPSTAAVRSASKTIPADDQTSRIQAPQAPISTIRRGMILTRGQPIDNSNAITPNIAAKAVTHVGAKPIV
ncbi:hypothetical protein QNH20_12365 [Neobacillus sp. WH10]|uniref:hypothetical protein n=1 Tax=Neobacillus sp. WH10 TaxID=3047873 RepID=UPI0024C20762|nr:hypothetical protein [Neobacillus sp. WH10]WHY79884.1 hypothetical protein QNH20_12365 [Neobacillus sp. WH10]